MTATESPFGSGSRLPFRLAMLVGQGAPTPDPVGTARR